MNGCARRMRSESDAAQLVARVAARQQQKALNDLGIRRDVNRRHDVAQHRRPTKKRRRGRRASHDDAVDALPETVHEDGVLRAGASREDERGEKRDEGRTRPTTTEDPNRLLPHLAFQLVEAPRRVRFPIGTVALAAQRVDLGTHRGRGRFVVECPAQRR